MYPEHLEGSRQEPRYRVRLPRAEGGGRRLEAGRMHMYDWMYGTENGVQHDETSTYFRSIASSSYKQATTPLNQSLHQPSTAEC